MPRKQLGSYEVGYGKPPRHTQFVSGKSGNPGGASPGGVSLARSVGRILSKKLLITENGKKRHVTMEHGILLGVAQKALKGDLRAAKLLLGLQQTLPPPEQINDGHAQAKYDRVKKGLEFLNEEELEQLGTIAAKIARLERGGE